MAENEEMESKIVQYKKVKLFDILPDIDKIFDVLDNMISIYGIDGKLLYTNKRSEEIYHGDLQDYIGEDMINFILDEEKQMVIDKFSQSLRNPYDVIDPFVIVQERMDNGEKFSSSWSLYYVKKSEVIVAIGRLVN